MSLSLLFWILLLLWIVCCGATHWPQTKSDWRTASGSLLLLGLILVLGWAVFGEPIK